MAETDFISTIYPLLSKLRCGHTQFEHSATYKPEKVPHLPFQVLVRDGKAWVTTHQTAALATGDELLTVNDVATLRLLLNMVQACTRAMAIMKPLKSCF
jgi:hypothetical protein